MDAVKVLDWGNDGHDTSAKHREAFEKEVAVWQKLDHPNVTKVRTPQTNPPSPSSEGRRRSRPANLEDV